MRIGVIHHFHEVDHKVSDGTQRGIDAAIATFRDLGAEISEVTLSPLAEWHACGTLISLTERAAAYDEWARTRLGDFGARVQQRLLMGAMVSGVDYVQAVRRRRELRAELKAAMAGLDVVLTAAQPPEAPKIDEVPEWDVGQKPSFTMPFNVAGYPAMSICSGFGEGGLPVAIQLVGKPFQEATRVARGRCVREGDTVPRPPSGATLGRSSPPNRSKRWPSISFAPRRRPSASACSTRRFRR